MKKLIMSTRWFEKQLKPQKSYQVENEIEI